MPRAWAGEGADAADVLARLGARAEAAWWTREGASDGFARAFDRDGVLARAGVSTSATGTDSRGERCVKLAAHLGATPRGDGTVRVTATRARGDAARGTRDGTTATTTTKRAREHDDARSFKFSGRPGDGTSAFVEVGGEAFEAYVRGDARAEWYAAQVDVAWDPVCEAWGRTGAYLRERGVSVKCWINGRDRVETNWHYDNYDNLLVVLEGEKTITLQPPAIAPGQEGVELYAAGTDMSNHALPTHPVNPRTRSRDHRPLNSVAERESEELKRRESHVRTVSISAGEAIFIPSGWLHHVSSEPHTVALSHWWTSDFNKTLEPTAFYSDDYDESALFSADKRTKFDYNVVGDATLFDGILGKQNTYYFRRAFEAALEVDIRNEAEMYARGERLPESPTPAGPSAGDEGARREDIDFSRMNDIENLTKSKMWKLLTDIRQNRTHDRGLGWLWTITPPDVHRLFRESDECFSLVTLLQNAKEDAYGGSYELAHSVDLIWRAIERNLTPRDSDEASAQEQWNRFYSLMVRGSPWYDGWAAKWKFNEERHRLNVEKFFTPIGRCAVPEPHAFSPYRMDTRDDVVRALLHNQRLALAHRAERLLRATLDDAYDVNIRFRDSTEV